MFMTGDSSINTQAVTADHIQVETNYHFGGYAKITDELVRFMSAFEYQFGFKLDAVYTAKMFFGLFDMIHEGRFDPGTTIVALHSGGLQGNSGFDLKTDSGKAGLEL